MYAFYVKITLKYFAVKRIINKIERRKVRLQVRGFTLTPMPGTIEGLDRAYKVSTPVAEKHSKFP